MNSWLARAFVIGVVAVSAACGKSTSSSQSATPAPEAAPAQTPAQSTATPAPADAPAQPAPDQTASASAPAVRPLPATLPDVVARVDGTPISKVELENAAASVVARAGREVPDDQRAAFTRQLLEEIVEFHILVGEARARKVEVTDAEVKARIGEMRKNFASEQAFQQALAQQHVGLKELETQTKMGLQVDKLVDAEITSKIAVQDSDVLAYYHQNLERFKQGESVHASHILIVVPKDATPAQKTAARASAEQVLKQVRGGADFARVAREKSQDPGSAPGGGDLGFFVQGQMEPSFEKAAFALKPGETSGVVETAFGFHIIKALERRSPRTATIDEVRAPIRQFLIEQERDKRLQALVTQAKTKTKIEILI